MAILNENKSKHLVDLAWAEEENRKVLRKFTEHALCEIAVDVIVTSSDSLDERDLMPHFMAEVNSRYGDIMESAQCELEGCLEEDAEISPENRHKMSPRDKINKYLESTCGVFGYTDDILVAISAAYDVVLDLDEAEL